MELYERSFFVNIIESKLLNEYSDYTPQGQYNNKFISCLYKYLKDNTYVGTHTQLYNELKKKLEPLSNTLIIEKETDKQTFTLTDDNGISLDVAKTLADILRKYGNYKYIVNSENRIQFQVKFGWLPSNASSWLNLLNEETLIDYYIDGITLRPNTHTIYNGAPDSGYICYKINGVQQYNTIMFLINDALKIEGKIKLASLLDKLKGSKGATLNRIVEFDANNAFYEIGPYEQNYLTTKESSLIIQVPYQYSVSEMLNVFDVSGSVLINNKNNKQNPNDESNFFVLFNDENYEQKFEINNISKETIQNMINNNSDVLDSTISQYLLGNFIWRTTDYKLISYAQNLIKALYNTVNTGIVTDGVWSDRLSKLIKEYKKNNLNSSVFNDDVIDKTTEEMMLFDYKKKNPNCDPNIELFKEW